MNESRLLRLLASLALVIAAACSSGGGDAPPLQGASIGGPFTLTDQDGREVSDQDFNGRYRLIYFGFTYCPDVCPVDLQLIGQAMHQLEKQDPTRAAKVQPIFITVDPERDTPAVMKQYVAAFHPRMIGLTGSEQEIANVAKRFGVYRARREEPGATDYVMDHSRITLLFGPKGDPIAIVPHDKGTAGVVAEIERWVA